MNLRETVELLSKEMRMNLDLVEITSQRKDIYVADLFHKKQFLGTIALETDWAKELLSCTYYGKYPGLTDNGNPDCAVIDIEIIYDVGPTRHDGWLVKFIGYDPEIKYMDQSTSSAYNFARYNGWRFSLL